MSRRKILSRSKNYYPAPAASDSAPDLNLDILLSSSPYGVASVRNTKKKLKSSSEAAAAAATLIMDARVPDRDRPDDDDESAATSDSSSGVINTEEEPFPSNSCSFNNTAAAAAAASSAFVFDILSKEGLRSPDAPPFGGGGGGENNRPTIHQLFPESSSVGGAGSELNLLAAPIQWLTLSEVEPAAGTPAGGGDVPPPKPAVQPRKSRRGPRSRSSQYRGVTFYRRTGRWESHIWDCGKQVYLGGFDTAHAASRAYDRAAIKFRGVDADINFNLSDYDEDMKAMKDLSKEEFVHVLRRQSSGFSRGSSKYRGVTLHKCGRWEARMGQLLANKAYDKAAIEYGGTGVRTNFQPRDLDTNTSAGREDDLDLRLGVSPNSTPMIEAARAPLAGKTVGVEGPSSSSAGPFGFQPLHLHGLPINIASPNNFPTWPPSSTFDLPQEIGGSRGGQARVVAKGSSNNSNNNIVPFMATTGGGGFAASWAHHHHHQLNSAIWSNDGVINRDVDVNNGVPQWPSSSQQIAASSGFLSSSNNSRPTNVYMAGSNSGGGGSGGSSSSSPNVNPFQTSQQQY